MLKLMFLLVTAGLIVMGGCVPDNVAQSPTKQPSQASVIPLPTHTVKLPLEIINSALVSCSESPDWAVGILDVTINYLVGVAVEGAIILHNGNDTVRLVTLEVEPTRKEINKNNKLYTFSPLAVSSWVTFGESLVRLEPAETKVVTVTLHVPKNVETIPDNWAFNILASGKSVSTKTLQFEVTTDATTEVDGETVPDDFLELKLSQSLLMDDLKAVVKLESSIGENLRVVKYDSATRTLRIEGLQPSITRVITIEQEYEQMVVIAYRQSWYISMMK